MNVKKPNEFPLVSVVIPTFNRGHFLSRSINSVLNQNFKNFELIVVDDGSTDNTYEIIQSFNNINLKYVRLDKNYGGSHARNIGILSSRGRYIAFQDSDDEWNADKLEKQVSLINVADKSVGVVYTRFKKIENRRITYIPSGKIKDKEGYILNEILKANFVSTQTVLIKKECFEKAGYFDDELPRLQDWDLFIRISFYYQFLIIEDPLVTVYHHQDNISSNNLSLIVALNKIINKYMFLFKNNKSIVSRHYFHLSYLQFFHSDGLEWKKNLKNSLKNNPLNMRSWCAFFCGFNNYKVIADFIKNICKF